MVGSGISLTADEHLEIRALLRLKQHPKLGDRGIRQLVDSHRSGVRALRAEGREMDLLRTSPEDPPISSWQEEGVSLLPMTSPRYPGRLLELTDPPPVLFLKGKHDLLTGSAVAIVGSRSASGVGRRVAETMGKVLSEAGVTVVSGMALGIDGAAHRGALTGGGNTVAVLGSGFRKVYPASHRPLFREIADRGLLVSEFLPEEPALPHHFPKRNRIIAALVQAIVVVEAGQRSGALITVDHGLDLGRDIFATPGSVENPQSVGSNALLREGARILLDPSDILEEIGDLGLGVDAGQTAPPEKVDPGEGIPVDLKGLWAALSVEPSGVEALARRAAVTFPEALAGLSALELGGWARQCPGMRFRRS
jgi:DNA processing protein